MCKPCECSNEQIRKQKLGRKEDIISEAGTLACKAEDIVILIGSTPINYFEDNADLLEISMNLERTKDMVIEYLDEAQRMLPRPRKA